MIELKKISKSFGTQVVLKDLDLTIPAGKVTVIIGRSGEGKSVLIKHMLGLIKPDQGQVVVDGQDLSYLDSYALNEFRKRFGMLFQYAALFDSMTVFDNIAFPLTEHTPMDAEEIRARVHELLGMVGLQPLVLDKFPSELSGGMRKRVGLARAIALNPKILLYDEPTTGLDPLMTDMVNQLILDTQRRLGITSVVISHDVNAVFAIADKIAMLHEGRILLSGTPDDFRHTKDSFVRSFFEGRAEPGALANS